MNYNQIQTIAFDADDTLWVNEPIFVKTEEKCEQIISRYTPVERIKEKIYEYELKNLKLFGYGVKGFTLSMIETAIELTTGKISGNEIQELIDLGKDMLQHPIHLLPGVQETIQQLAGKYELLIITKGDLFDQESKIARSGLADLFDHIEIVSEKNVATYAHIMQRYGIAKEHFLMIGNSLKSDILPICTLGAKAIHVPYHTTWVHEKVEERHLEGVEYEELSSLEYLFKLLKKGK
ncbi:MAG: HAD family hydrolase [Flammeovirgaceae bacterium]